MGLTSSAAWLGQWAWYFSAARSGAGWPYTWWQVVPYSGLTAIALGLYVFFGGRWIANLAIPGNRPYCAECGYDLTRAGAAACPECGTPRAEAAAPGAVHAASSAGAAVSDDHSRQGHSAGPAAE